VVDRVSFSLEWRPKSAPESLFRLRGLVIHVGKNMSSGHYISCALIEGKWFLFNDDSVKIISALQLSSFFGGPNSIYHAYLLFYEKV
jgi:ubiquitin C-terminal hydrolase